MSARREQALVIGFALAALLSRLVAALAFPVTPVSDSQAYHQLAQALAAGHGLTLGGRAETVWAPGYPLFVSGVYALFGARWVAVYALQAVVDVGFCLVLWWWTRRRVGAQAALVALALAAVSFSAIASVRLLRTEILATWLLLSALALVDLSRAHRREIGLMAAAGALLGALTLSRWQFSLFPLLVVGLLLWQRRARSAAVLFALYLAVIAPWMLRNQSVVGSPVLSTQTGTTLYMSHFRNPGQAWGVNTSDENTAAAAAMDPLAGNRFLVEKSLEKLAQNPTIVVRKYPEKLFYLLVPLDWEVLRDRRTVNVTYLVMALLALFGLRAAWQSDRQWVGLLLLPLAYLVVMTLPFYGSPRFRLPVEPLLMPVAALGVLRLRKRAPETALAEASG
jgi:4-amino-4-deoxy-L-arabinose transferase-like glycosyltransferase